MANTDNNNAVPNFSNPFRDLTKVFAQFKMPGVDMSALMDARRKDVEALVAANKATYEAMQALARTQTEMLTQSMKAMQEAGKAMLAGDSKGTEHTLEAAGNAWNKMLADMKTLAEAVRKSQTEAVASMTQGASRIMQETRQAMLPK
jgi:hypothetical protein